MDHVTKGKPGAFFIDGPAGTGKLFYKMLYAKIRSMNKIVLPTATSGIAAANIPSGRTAHSRFKIPLDPLGSLAYNVPKQGSLAALLRETTLIIWDEAYMAKNENIESLDSLLRGICSSSELFGGKIVVFGGDFRQVLPIIPRKTQQEAVTASLVTSALWPQLLKFRLNENLRAKDDPEYAAYLLALGNGELQNTEDAFVELPLEIVKPCYNGEADDVHLTAVAFPEYFYYKSYTNTDE
ncbi:ATP-dependent DNA helicase PIF5-like [Chenopodium quinoa]|uniref:ATP-dependent DNA helicase PIF5-like n=1 Tax=Chenopodium quinoa TaxID=63459 RepID=UPI000B795F68|nr:ATP-dependent DNA helicase PIF5-like [Chenopodium quinoa]